MKLAVITLGVTDAGRQMLAITEPILRQYSTRVGATFHAITDDSISPRYPLAAKFQVGRYFAHYDRILFLDSDIIPSPTCPDLFALVPVDQVGMYDDTANMLRDSDGSWLKAEYEAICDSQGWEYPSHLECLNTGVVVASRQHADMFRPPSKPYPVRHCSEQNLIGLNLRREGYTVYDLPENVNWQWWAHRETFATDRPAIAHFAGMSQSTNIPGAPGPAGRLQAMRERVAELYPEQPEPEKPSGGCGCGPGKGMRKVR